MKPIIGLIGRPDAASDDDKVICIWESTRRAIVKKGGIPLLILPNQDFVYETTRPRDAARLTEEEKEELKTIVDMCDGILIPGGYKRYEYDEVIYKYALEKDMPILGICCGAQLIGAVDGATITKNETILKHHQRDEKFVHGLKIVDNTLLKQIINLDEIKVNSKHNYHVEGTNNLIVSGYSEDGLIEALEYPNKRFVIGVQWHPESMLEYDESSNKLFDYFIKECSNYNLTKQ